MTQWIKCSERVPDKNIEVLCIKAKTGEMLIGALTEISGVTFVCESYSYKLYGVTHWMPLPEGPTQ